MEKPLAKEVSTAKIPGSSPVSRLAEGKRARFEMFSTKKPSPLVKRKRLRVERVQAVRDSTENSPSTPPSPPPSSLSKDNQPLTKKNAATAKRASDKRNSSPPSSLDGEKRSRLENHDAKESSSLAGKPPTPPTRQGSLKSKKNLRLDRCPPKKDSTGNITMGTPHYSQPTFQVCQTREEVRF